MTDASRPGDANGRIVALDAPLAGLQLIEASAGTGKTWTISGLFVRLVVEKGLPVEHILTISFTRAATAELRERIRMRLQALALAADARDPTDDDPLITALLERIDAPILRARTEAALRSFDASAIYTIHGFCQRALADRALSSGTAFATEIVQDVGDWVYEIVADFWRRRIAVPAEGAQALFVDWLMRKGHSPETLATSLRGLLGKPPFEVLQAAPADDGALARIQARWTDCRTQWRQSRESIDRFFAQTRLSRSRYQARHLPGRLAKMDAWFDGSSPFPACDVAHYFGRTTLLEAGLGEQPCPPVFDAVDALCAELAACEQIFLQRWRQLRLELFDELRRELPARLGREHRQGYDDLLRQLHEALSHEHGATLAAQLRARYPAALVDEFQDTDGLQWGILRCLYAGAPPATVTAFLVGDPKQAIYSFRGADVYAYLAATAHCGARFDLRQNHRSAPPLVRALNTFFLARTDAFRHEHIRYLAVEAAARPKPALVDDGQTDAAPLRLMLCDTRRNKEQGRDWAAALTAGEIARLLAAASEGRVLLGDRVLRAGDIAVLVNTHRQAGLVREALSARGIASAEQSAASVFDSPEAEQLERVLHAVAAPQDTGRVRAALATDLMGADASALATLDDADDHEWALSLERFARWHQLWRERGSMRMLREWLREAGVTERVARFADGERRLTNLLHLGELLHAQSRQQPGMDALLGWFAAQRLDSGGEAAELRLDSDSALVQILTIHRAKGLEFPVCFVPFLWDSKTRSGDDDLVLFHDPAAPERLLLDAGSDQSEHARAQAREEALAEQLRLAYVALTRAKNRCYLHAGELSGVESSALNWLLFGGEAAAEKPELPDEPACRARLDELVRDSGGTIRVERIAEAWSGAVGTSAPTPVLAAAPLRRAPPRPRITTSFTALLRELDGETPQADYDELVPPSPGDDDGAATTAIEHRFVRGAQTGVCLHAILERLDFGDPRGRQAVTEQELRKAGFDTALAPEVCAWIGRVLDTPLQAHGPRLAAVPAARQLRELEFELPLRGTPPAAITALLRAHGHSVSALAGERIDGFLRGFVDLVFVDDASRWWIADYKSNALGNGDGAYTEAALEAAMGHSDYPLQAILYLLALHRWLRSREPGYDYDRDIAGAAYLFLRGMRPDSPGRGVVRLRPARALIDALDALFEGRSR